LKKLMMPASGNWGKQVDAICRTTGFLAIRNHSVPQAIIDAVWGKAHTFFDLPPEEKQNARAPYKGYPYGYLGPELEALAKSRDIDSPPDLKESLTAARWCSRHP
jgi:isopenicillin N synthase-like dioxygenase